MSFIKTTTDTLCLHALMLLAVSVFTTSVVAQDCSDLEEIIKELQYELSLVRAQNEALLQEKAAQEISNEFLRGKNDDLIDEIVPMRFYNKKYEKLRPQVAALTAETEKLREDSLRNAAKIEYLKSGIKVELLDQLKDGEMVGSGDYLVSDINVRRLNDSNIDTEFYLEPLSKKLIPNDKGVPITIKVFARQRDEWLQIVYGEKGSKTYDKYYKTKPCKPGQKNKIRYHSVNTFNPKEKVEEYRIEFYHEKDLIGTHSFGK